MSGGLNDIFVLKVSAAGELQWGKYFGDTGYDDFGTAAVLDSSYVYVFGYGTGLTTSNGMDDIRMLKLAQADGAETFAEYMGNTLIETVGGGALLADGRMVIAAGSQSVSLSSESPDLLIIQLDAKGRNQCANLNIKTQTSPVSQSIATDIVFVDISQDPTTLSSSATTISSGATLSTSSLSTTNFCTNYDPIPPEEEYPSIGAFYNIAFSFQVPEFCDSTGDTLTYASTTPNPLPTWLSFDASTRTYSGTPNDLAFLATHSMVTTATDSQGRTGTFSFTLVVNRKPEVSNAISDQETRTGSAWSFTFADNTFTDPDGDTLTYTDDLSGSKSWLSFDSDTRTFSGTPENTDVGVFTVTVTATDPTGGAASTSFVLTIIVNYVPIVATAIDDKTIPLNAEWTFQFPENTFTDGNSDTLTYTASGLPSTITLTSGTRTFQGTPTTSNTYTVSLKADDGWSGTVTATFTLITGTGKPNNAPTTGATTIPD